MEKEVQGKKLKGGKEQRYNTAALYRECGSLLDLLDTSSPLELYGRDFFVNGVSTVGCLFPTTS